MNENVSQRHVTGQNIRIRPHSVYVIRRTGTGSQYRIVAQFCGTSYCRNQGSNWVDYAHRAAVSSGGYASGRVDIYTRK